MGKHSEKPVEYEQHTGAGLDENTDVFLAALHADEMPLTQEQRREGAKWRFEVWYRTSRYVSGTSEFEWVIFSSGWSAVDFEDADVAAHKVLDDWFWWNHVRGDDRRDYSIRCAPADADPDQWVAGADGIEWGTDGYRDTKLEGGYIKPVLGPYRPPQMGESGRAQNNGGHSPE